MKKLLLIFNFILFLNLSYGQDYALSGNVTSSVSGEGINSCLVSVKGTDISTHTDNTGFYFLIIPGDKTIIDFSAEGFKNQEINVSDDIRALEELDIIMDPKAEGDIYYMSMDELMNIQMNVASGSKSLTQRESPGIVSIVTQEEIQNSGARDLIDVLRLVPGISFGVDVCGAVGITMRGNWGHEGKVLLMIDGQEMNELQYSTNEFGNHYSVDQIKKIEIIRGPGSSIYGGFAELGVINIITQSGEDISGIKAGGIYGYLSDTYGRENVHLEIGKKVKDFEFSALGFMGKGTRSAKDYTDFFGNTYNMKGESALDPTTFNIALKYKTLSARFIYDDYHTTTRDWFGLNLLKAYSLDFKTLSGELKYDIKIGKKFTLTPKLSLIDNKPWTSVEDSLTGEDPSYFYYNKSTLRMKGNLSASYDATEKFNILFGGEYYQDRAKSFISGDLFWTGENTVKLSNVSGFLQAIYKSDFANITLGARFENHSIFGTAFAPRFGITKVIDNFHIKALLSQAYRSPGIENINLSAAFSVDGKPTIKPEISRSVELELGYIFNSNMSISANLFYINIKQPIVYFIDSLDREGYFNKDRSGTSGIELEYRLRGENSYATLNYSYYSAKGINQTDDYAVPGNESALLGAPQHRIMLNGSLKIFKGFSFNPTIIFMGKRYGYTSYDIINDAPVLTEFKPVILANVFLNYRDLFTKGLDLGIGVYDIIDSDLSFIQPYNGGHSPIPTQGREYIVKLSYGFKL